MYQVLISFSDRRVEEMTDCIVKERRNLRFTPVQFWSYRGRKHQTLLVSVITHNKLLQKKVQFSFLILQVLLNQFNSHKNIAETPFNVL
jgi:hypothetical protein